MLRLTVEYGTTYKIEIDPDVLIEEFHDEWLRFLDDGPGGEVTDLTKKNFVLESLEIMGVHGFTEYAASYTDYDNYTVTT